MATVDILAAFGYKWAELGIAEPLTDAQWKTGWSFIGSTPPSVEQFNKWGQIFDEKSNYLYSQLNTIYGLTGVVPAVGDANSLRNALRGTGLFLTAAPGTSDTSAATTAFVGAAITAAQGRLIGLRVFTTNQTYTPTPGTSSVVVTVVGAGGGGGAAQTTGAAQCAAGSGGGGGGWAKERITAAFSGVSITIGVGGTGGTGGAGGTGGTTSFGALVSAAGGAGGSFGNATANSPPSVNGGALGGSGSGGHINGTGGLGNYAVYTVVPVSGKGGSSLIGEGAQYVNALTTTPGTAANVAGAGGSGGANGAAQGAGAAGGNGAPGICIIEEYA